MRHHLLRAQAIPAIILLSLIGAAATHAQVNGNATIKAPDPVFGEPLTVSTSTQYAGAVMSIKWADKEYINNWDHGRQLQLNSQFFNRFICYNPYEAGGFSDGAGPTSSSKLLSLTASGNQLQSTTQMAWYYREYNHNPEPQDYCGDPAHWLPVTPYTTPLSNYTVHKKITIGFAGIPNAIEYLTDHYIPEPVLKGLNNVTAVVNYDFSSVRSWDVISKDYRTVRMLSGEDDRIKVVSTPDGSHAMGFYSPELLQPYGDPGTANWWFVVPPHPFYPDPDYACVHFGSVNRYDSFPGSGVTHDRAYLVVGNLDQVKEGLANVHLQFRALDPEVYNWRDYLALNGLAFGQPVQEAAQNHWLTQGISQGLRASKTFSASHYLQLNPDIAGAFGADNYQAAIDHFVGAGRAEGRTTVAKAAAGMQHLLVFANRKVNGSGHNGFSQLGTSSPPNISSLDNTVTEIAAGDYTSFAVKTDGSLWVWGANQYGARGDGSSGGNLDGPVQVPIPKRVTTPSRRGKHAVAIGTGVYAAVDTDGYVWTWGVNWNGRLGDGTANSRFIPARVKKSAIPDDYLTGIVSIAAGGGTLAAIDADGTVWTWGAGANGALGNGFTQDSAYPVQVLRAGSNDALTPLSGVSEVACGSSGFCIALAGSSAVFGWGSNSFSQLGIAAGGSSSIAMPINVGPSSIDAIAAGSSHAIAQGRDGNVYGWGYNGRGQLGIGSTAVAISPPAPMNAGPDGMNNISEIAAGPNFSVMVRYTDRAIFVTGDNQSGQLRIPGNPPKQMVPVRASF